MSTTTNNFNQLLVEHLALGRQYSAVQQRCSDLISLQQAQINALQAKAMRLRAAIILRETQLSLAREASIELTHQIIASAVDNHRLEASLKAADLVICQTGCLSHGAYWRVQDHCKRTGKSCVLVENPEAVRIVRIHTPKSIEQMSSKT